VCACKGRGHVCCFGWCFLDVTVQWWRMLFEGGHDTAVVEDAISGWS